VFAGLSDINFDFASSGSSFELGRMFFLDSPGSVGKHLTRISRVHCRILFVDEEKFVLEDVGANGTWLNGRRIGKGNQCVLQSGDKITLLFDIEGDTKKPLLEYEFLPQRRPQKHRARGARTRQTEPVQQLVTNPTDNLTNPTDNFTNPIGDLAKPTDNEEMIVSKRRKVDESLGFFAAAAQVGVFAVGSFFLMSMMHVL
jgi:hypothetical protein